MLDVKWPVFGSLLPNGKPTTGQTDQLAPMSMPPLNSYSFVPAKSITGWPLSRSRFHFSTSKHGLDRNKGSESVYHLTKMPLLLSNAIGQNSLYTLSFVSPKVSVNPEKLEKVEQIAFVV